jgi:DNA-binding NarL/FixJ family response regulator
MRALVIDDHPLIHDIMRAVLQKAFGDVGFVAETTLESAIALAGGELPDLVLLDLGLPGYEGLDALLRFRMHFPEVPLVVLSGTLERASILRALDEGAVGYLTKTSTPEVMVAALRLVAAGGTYVPPEALEPSAARRARDPELDLTARQKDVLRLILKGYNNERIALELAIAPNTVKQHAHAIFTALGVSSRAEAVIAATRHGLGVR